ncbi:hypothetical protein [Nocardia sp. SC052]|uniref:hypothetical protein n=1 Tax=Nocardia sichangensis TaxID=3385975 RepID=UPI0039A3EE0F
MTCSDAPGNGRVRLERLCRQRHAPRGLAGCRSRWCARRGDRTLGAGTDTGGGLGAGARENDSIIAPGKVNIFIALGVRRG